MEIKETLTRHTFDFCHNRKFYSASAMFINIQIKTIKATAFKKSDIYVTTLTYGRQNNHNHHLDAKEYCEK